MSDREGIRLDRGFTKERIEAVRASAAEMDRSGEMSEAALALLYDLRLLKLFVPEEFGGRMEALPEALRLFEAASRVEGSLGWAATIGSGGGYFAACLPPEVSAAIYSDPRAVIAGSGSPTGRAVRVEGGYRLSGSWKYCSGSTYATTFTATAIVEGGEAAELEVLAFALRPEQAEIVPDWRSFGLRATASHTIVAKDAFVPDSHAFRVDRNDRRSEPVYSVPFRPFAESSFAAVAIGIARHLFEEAGRIAEASRDAWSKSGAARYEAVSTRIRRAGERLDERAARYYEAVERAWARHSRGDASEADWADVGLKSKAAADEAVRAGQDVFRYLGIGALMEDAPINRIWRDLQTACQHTLLIDFGTEPA
jgi:alkylation response protein AidB-like acyl-CoA dehydrogenase